MKALLAQITDGRAAWGEFFAGVQKTFEDNAASVPVLLVCIGVLVVVLLDIWFARWVVRRGQRKGRTKRRA